jgi:hypothetical protein
MIIIPVLAASLPDVARTGKWTPHLDALPEREYTIYHTSMSLSTRTER